MSRFAATLRRAAERLDLPQPARSRVLLELAADLDDMYDHLRASGRDDEAAYRETLQRCDLSDQAVDQLAAVHRGPARRLIDRLPVRTLRLWERGLLLVMFLTAVQAGGWLSRTDCIIRDAGPWAWPVLVVAAAALVLATGKAYQLFVKQDHGIRRLRRGLAPLLNCSVGLAFLGFALSWADVFRQIHLATVVPVPAAVVTLRWALTATALLQLGLGSGLLGAVAWFGLARKVSRIERSEAELLLNLPAPGPDRGPQPEDASCNS